MAVRILSQDVPKERGAGCQYHLVSLHLIVLTGDGHVKEILIITKLSEGHTDVRLEVVPLEAKLLCCCHLCFCSASVVVSIFLQLRALSPLPVWPASQSGAGDPGARL